MPQNPILFCEILDVWAIDFMRLFHVSSGYVYILLVVDNVSRKLKLPGLMILKLLQIYQD